MSNFFLKYFQLSDVFSAIAWLILLTTIVVYRSFKFESSINARRYRQNFFFKILFSIIFTIYYLEIVQGGDTVYYWEASKVIQNLIFEDPLKGITHLFTTPSAESYNQFFDATTGYPPGWVYRDAESYFVSKVAAVLGLFTFKSYLAVTFIFSYLFAKANWKIFEIASDSGLFQSKWLPLAILFIPSVAFWCSGLTKDTLVIVSLFHIIYQFYNIFIKGELRAYSRWLIIVFYAFFIYHTRSFLLITVIAPLMAAMGNSLYRKLNPAPIFKLPLNFLIVAIIVGGSVAFMSSPQGSNLIMNNAAMQEALVIQNDFTNNKTYGENRYSLGKVDNSPFGIVKAMPWSIIAGIYEPFPWNGLSISLFLNALESALLLGLTFYLIGTGAFLRWGRTITQNKVLVFCLTFVLLSAFIAGFTAIIYGVLVRFRAPLLPFWFALLIINIKSKEEFNSTNNPNEEDNPTAPSLES